MEEGFVVFGPQLRMCRKGDSSEGCLYVVRVILAKDGPGDQYPGIPLMGRSLALAANSRR